MIEDLNKKISSSKSTNDNTKKVFEPEPEPEEEIKSSTSLGIMNKLKQAYNRAERNLQNQASKETGEQIM